MRCLILMIISVLVLVSTAFAWPAKVVGVTDGDTVTVLRISKANSKAQYKVRLYGIDAPESGQAFGKASKENLSALVFGKTVEIDDSGIDRYGRIIGWISADGVDVNAAQVQAGLAWVYEQYCVGATKQIWKGYQAVAQQEKRGLWADSNPMAPWDWRHGGKASAGSIAGTQSRKSVYTPSSSISAGTGYVSSYNQGSSVASSSGGGPYSGNTHSHKFHRSGCRYYGCKNCGASFSTREEAINAGYSPCGVCNP